MKENVGQDPQKKVNPKGLSKGINDSLNMASVEGKKKSLKSIPVTRTFLPPIEEYNHYLLGLWESRRLTNNGPLVQELEGRLQDFLGVENVVLVTNGTLALQLAIRSLDLQGEIITTPFSYVASVASMVWERCKPVFAEIDPESLCLNPKAVEKLITEKTVGILPVHIYGYPCDVEAFERISNKYKIPVIYDAAHTFGMRHQKQSILHFGNVSILSFHATKIFHTFEGGALITKDSELAERIRYMRNFGKKEADTFAGLGINAKLTEPHAAMGLCMLNYIEGIIARNKERSLRYDQNFRGRSLKRPLLSLETEFNYSYYPVIFQNEKMLEKVILELNRNNIHPRRYFYPSLADLNYVTSGALPISRDLATRAMCLPLYSELDLKDIDRISAIVIKCISD